MGSESDLPVMAECVRVLEGYSVGYDVRILSAHRSPELASRFAKGALRRGVKVIVAGAGASAHLAGAMAAHTVLPVIGVPLEGSPLHGIDALLSTVQMPPGVPVATVGIGSMGARNAGHLAVAILALSDPGLREKLRARRAALSAGVAGKARGLSKRLRAILDRA